MRQSRIDNPETNTKTENNLNFGELSESRWLNLRIPTMNHIFMTDCLTITNYHMQTVNFLICCVLCSSCKLFNRTQNKVGHGWLTWLKSMTRLTPVKLVRT